MDGLGKERMGIEKEKNREKTLSNGKEKSSFAVTRNRMTCEGKDTKRIAGLKEN